MIKVEDMMTRHPHTLSADKTLNDARELMNIHDIRHIPIIDDNQHLLGLISQRDILRAQESCLNQQSSDSSIFCHPLSEVMHKNVMSVSPKAGLKESALYMQKHKVGCLPVLNKNKLVGIITDSDFVSIAINLIELQEEVEPDEIDIDDEF